MRLVSAVLGVALITVMLTPAAAAAPQRGASIENLRIETAPADRQTDVRVVGAITTKTLCSPSDLLCDGGWMLTTGPENVSCRQQAPQINRWRVWESPTLDSHSATRRDVSWSEDSSTQGLNVRVCLRPGSLIGWSLKAYAETVLAIPLPAAGLGATRLGTDIRSADSISLKYARSELRRALMPSNPPKKRLTSECRRVNVALVQCRASWTSRGRRARERFDVSLEGEGDEIKVERRLRGDEI